MTASLVTQLSYLPAGGFAGFVIRFLIDSTLTRAEVGTDVRNQKITAARNT